MPRGHAENERPVRDRIAGDQRIERQVHGGHDGGVREVSGVRTEALALL